MMADIKIAAIILAAGQSQRFGDDNKLLAPYRGAPLIDHCIDLVSNIDFHDRVLVGGHQQDQVRATLQYKPVRVVFNADYKSGMGTSLARGVNALDRDIDAFMVFLADMPEIAPSLVGDIVDAFTSNRSRISIVRPLYRNTPGHPVLFSNTHSEELRFLTRDQGASEVIQKHSSTTLNIEVEMAGSIKDIDRPDDLKN